MKALEEIKAPIAEEMKLFEKKFSEFMKSDVPLLDKIMHYIIKRKGKQLRPVFVFLTAKLCGTINEATYRAAALIELLHTATLVHDDVVDDAGLRRGFFSVNALWKNKIAVLVGDYLLSRGLILSVDHQDYQLLQIVTDAVKKMSEGELLQMEKARMLNIDEETYFRIISAKTASLIAACCKCGAASVGAKKEVIRLMETFGHDAGIAFQIKDDLFDYPMNGNPGKPTGIDIREKKMTLPLIHTLSQSVYKDRKRIRSIVGNAGENPEKISEVIDLVIAKGGINYSKIRMDDYRNKALASLESFQPSDAKQALSNLINFTVARKR